MRRFVKGVIAFATMLNVLSRPFRASGNPIPRYPHDISLREARNKLRRFDQYMFETCTCHKSGSFTSVDPSGRVRRGRTNPDPDERGIVRAFRLRGECFAPGQRTDVSIIARPDVY